MSKVLKYWPLILGVLALVVWLVRLEARVNNSAPVVDQAVLGQKLDDLKERVVRIEDKVDQLSKRK